MKISVDCDDVLSDSVFSYIGLANALYGFELNEKNYHPVWQRWENEWGKEVRDKLYVLAHSDILNVSMRPVLGAVEAIKKIRELGVEMVIITSRGTPTKDATKQWVRKYFSDSFSKIIHCNGYVKKIKDKHEYCFEEGVTLHIEDNPLIAENLANKGILNLLLDKPWNRSLVRNKYIVRVKDWEEIVTFIEKLIVEKTL